MSCFSLSFPPSPYYLFSSEHVQHLVQPPLPPSPSLPHTPSLSLVIHVTIATHMSCKIVTRFGEGEKKCYWTKINAVWGTDNVYWFIPWMIVLALNPEGCNDNYGICWILLSVSLPRYQNHACVSHFIHNYLWKKHSININITCSCHVLIFLHSCHLKYSLLGPNYGLDSLLAFPYILR